MSKPREFYIDLNTEEKQYDDIIHYVAWVTDGIAINEMQLKVIEKSAADNLQKKIEEMEEFLKETDNWSAWRDWSNCN